MFYPATFTPAPEGGFVVTFRDIPEAITQGDDKTDAIIMAEDVLLSSMDFYFEDQRPVPMPSEPLDGEVLIELPTSVFAKVLLLNEMLAQNVSNAELARRMSIKPQEVTRIVKLSHTTKIDTIATALRQLGKNLNLVLAAA
ncbi:MAG: type II toxin-antitoxin system HicB family antitoxin [Neisseriaceae bacterium]|nr:type II toxin-antitoxin system HicB family antitoxin [Neisseriaceae bacterium]